MFTNLKGVYLEWGLPDWSYYFVVCVLVIGDEKDKLWKTSLKVFDEKRCMTHMNAEWAAGYWRVAVLRF